MAEISLKWFGQAGKRHLPSKVTMEIHRDGVYNETNIDMR